MAEKKVYQAIADYDGVDPGELRFRENDYIIVTEPHESGWWKGESTFDGEAGLFPSNHVEEVVDPHKIREIKQKVPHLFVERREEESYQLQDEEEETVHSVIPLSSASHHSDVLSEAVGGASSTPTVFSVSEWLGELGLEKYAQNFVDNGFDMLSDCEELTDDDLKEIGITAIGHRKRFLKAAGDLKNKKGQPRGFGRGGGPTPGRGGGSIDEKLAVRQRPQQQEAQPDFTSVLRKRGGTNIDEQQQIRKQQQQQQQPASPIPFRTGRGKGLSIDEQQRMRKQQIQHQNPPEEAAFRPVRRTRSPGRMRQQQQPRMTRPQHGTRSSNPAAFAQSGAPPKPLPVAPAKRLPLPPPKVKKEPTVRATHDYRGEDDNELSFSRGTIIKIVVDDDGDGWIQGELNRKLGWFPAGFVEKLP